MAVWSSASEPLAPFPTDDAVVDTLFRLAAAGVRVEQEWVESRQQHFAHAFGAIPLRQNIASVEFSAPAAASAEVELIGEKTDDKSFALVSELRTSSRGNFIADVVIFDRLVPADLNAQAVTPQYQYVSLTSRPREVSSPTSPRAVVATAETTTSWLARAPPLPISSADVERASSPVDDRNA